MSEIHDLETRVALLQKELEFTNASLARLADEIAKNNKRHERTAEKVERLASVMEGSKSLAVAMKMISGIILSIGVIIAFAKYIILGGDIPR